jgi:hypothetical protein
MANNSRKKRRSVDFESLVDEVERAPTERPGNISDIRRWRSTHGLPTANISEPARRVFAADLFGVPVKELHAVKSQYTKWDPPEYVVREPLRYEKLCHTVWLLRWKLQYTVDEIVESIGIREEDVHACVEVYSKYLDRIGVLCPTCGLRTDPRRGVYCCTECGNA